MTFSPARPIGVRATGNQENSLEFARDASAEMAALSGRSRSPFDPEMAHAVRVKLWQEVRALVRKAVAGVLSFAGSDPEAKELRGLIYELRPRAGELEPPSRTVRVYMGEPALDPRVLWLLHVATKPGDGPDLGGEQNTAIEEAIARAESWEMEKVKGRVVR